MVMQETVEAVDRQPGRLLPIMMLKFAHRISRTSKVNPKSRLDT